MNADRLKALTDGMVAVIITIMVLEMKAPMGASLGALAELWPIFFSYVLSFVYIAIYWNNHHHFFVLVGKVNGAILWANFNLLFWLSLVPFATAWFGEHALQPWPSAFYGLVLSAAAIAFIVLQTVIIRTQGAGSAIAQAVGQDWKGKASLALYILGICLSFLQPALAMVVYAVVACMWLVPDRRVHEVAASQALQKWE
jgi:uncharacterized membrane protein